MDGFFAVLLTVKMSKTFSGGCQKFKAGPTKETGCTTEK
jgi:hypothetical protein